MRGGGGLGVQMFWGQRKRQGEMGLRGEDGNQWAAML